MTASGISLNVLHGGNGDMNRTGILLLLLILTGAVSFGDTSAIDSMWFEGLKPFRREAFISPDVCGRCHGDIHEMWDGSMHSSAFDDPLFRAASKLLIKDVKTEGERADAEHCVACHNPVAYRSGQVRGTSDNYDNVDEVTRNSLFCDVCHSITEIVHTTNTSFNTEPGNGEDDPGVKQGPRDDAAPMYHEAAYSEIHTSAIICGTCHNVTHLWYMTKLEGTYDEWYHSPYNLADPGKRVVCQDCHMRQAPGKPSTGMTERPDYPGTSADMGPERPHIYRHNVVGGNAFVPDMLGHPEKSQLARERLTHAAALDIMADKQGKQLDRFTVRVRNEGAGHMLPTGVTEFRQMWLEVTVKDGKGRTVFSSGILDDKGGLPEDARLFHTVFGDPEGNPTINVARADRMLSDHRILPKGFCDETFVLEKPLKKPLTITVRLNYRSMDPSVVSLLLGDKARAGRDVPVITMTEMEKRIE